jgi:uncharacterized protein
MYLLILMDGNSPYCQNRAAVSFSIIIPDPALRFKSGSLQRNHSCTIIEKSQGEKFMHILILGATGRVGSKVLELALADEHSVTALVRSRQKAAEQMVKQIERSGRNKAQTQGITLIQSDSRVEQDLRSAIQDADAVISCLSTDGGSVLSETTPLLIKVMKENGVRRILTVGTAGILQSREYPDMLRYESPETRRSSTRAAEEHRKAWELLAASGLEWTVICPTYLPEGERLGRYRVEKDFLPDGGMSISVADTAEFTYSELLRDEFINCRVGIAY